MNAPTEMDEADGFPEDPATGGADQFPNWFEDLRPGGTGRGFLEKGIRHSLLFVERPVRRLLVTFDNLSNIGDRSVGRETWAYKFARDNNISHLGVMAHVGNWYRDVELIARMQSLADSGFFQGYDRVTFAGVSMGGFASVAFASLVPGAHVVAVNPQSTLDMDLVPWETRYEKGRRQDWTLPLSDSAALTSDLGPVQIFYDPYHALDQKHVDRYSGSNIRVFKCRYSQHKTAVFLRKIDALKPIMHEAIFGDLTEAQFYSLYRARRSLPWFRGAVSSYFARTGREDVADRFTKAFRARLRNETGDTDTGNDAEDGTAASGVTGPVPAPMAPADAIAGAAEPAAESRTPPAGKRPAKPAEDHAKSDDGARDAKAASQPDPAQAAALSERRRHNARRTIFTTMKNEGPFMLEWVAYNRSIGFTDIKIYTNDCSDGTDAIAMRLDELGLAQHEDNAKRGNASPQRSMLRKALRDPLYAESDWVLCCDCDEFLNVRVGDGTLDALLEAAAPADAISVCWKLFGCGGQVEYNDVPVIGQFTWATPEEYRDKYRALGLKTMFRPGQPIDRFGVHRPKFDYEVPKQFLWRDAGGQLMPMSYFKSGWSAYPGFRHDYARLHHYSVRSIDSFLVKRDRGRTNHVDQDQGLAYWADMNLNIEADTSMLPMVERTRRALDEMLADPELARLHAAACDWHRGRIEALKADPEWAAFHDLLQKVNPPGTAPEDSADLVKAHIQEMPQA